MSITSGSRLDSDALFTWNADPILLLNHQGIVMSVNKSAEGLAGHSMEEWIGTPLSIRMAANYVDRFALLLQGALSDEVGMNEFELIHSQGYSYPCQIRLIPNHLAGHLYIYAIIRDLTQNRIANRLIEHMAYYDTLTGLPNRTMLQIDLTRILTVVSRERTPFALLLIRLERLQRMSDTLGHSTVDLILKQISTRLKAHEETGEGICYRSSSDEFIIVFDYVESKEYVYDLMVRLRQELAKPPTIGEHEVYLAVASGASVYPFDGEDSDALIRHAADSQIREDGRGGYAASSLCPDEVGVSAKEQLTLENDLRKALERGQFEVHYQPQMDIRTNTLIGMEALVRWRHPVHGLVSPAQFIPVAEETGLIISIGEWVLHTACKQTKKWHDAGFGQLSVSVNLSVRQFHKSNLIGDIYGILRDTGLPAHCLELEITESTAMVNVERIIRKLHELKYIGIRISMDDFGTGYSSLQYLRRIPLNKLKIDQSFIRNMSKDEGSAAIVSTIIAMANGLQLEVVAEGVETADDLKFLQSYQCGQAQGYYFSRPLDADSFEKQVLSR